MLHISDLYRMVTYMENREIRKKVRENFFIKKSVEKSGKFMICQSQGKARDKGYQYNTINTIFILLRFHLTVKYMRITFYSFNSVWTV